MCDQIFEDVSKSEVNKIELKATILKTHCLQLIIKNAGEKVFQKIPTYTPYILEKIEQFQDEDMVDSIPEELMSQFLVALVSIVTSFFANNEKQIVGWLNSSNKLDKVVELVTKVLQFNPNMPGFLMDDESEGIKFQV